MNIALDQSQVAPSVEALERHISRASKALLAGQHEDGHWCFELEADATIPAEYVLLRHFRGEKPDLELERLIAVYLRRIQGDHGGWPLVHAGPFDMSASVKAYFALKMIGDEPDAPYMAHAREAILAHGGAAKSNVFTRFLLALYGAIPWRGVPTMPVEIMLLPRWFPFHLDKVSYWARTVMVPLLVLQALKPRPANPRGVTIPELFVAPPETVREWPTGAHQALGGGQALRCDRLAAQARRTFLSAVRAPPRNCRRRGFRDRAPQWRGRPRGDLSRHGQCGAHVRCARLSARPSASHHRPPIDREAARRQQRRSLLPALPVARVGHRARGPRADGVGR